MARRKKWSKLNKRRRKNILKAKRNKGLSKKQIKRKYNTNARKYNQRLKKNQQRQNKRDTMSIFGTKNTGSFGQLLGTGPTLFGGKKSGSVAKPDGLGPTFGNSAQRNQPKDKWGRTPSNLSSAFTKQGKWHAPMVGGPADKWHPPMAGGPASSGSGTASEAVKVIEDLATPDTKTPKSTAEELNPIIGDKEFGITPEAEEFDFAKFLSSIPQEDYTEQQLEMPKMPGVRTDISGGSAGGIRRRRSKRSRMGFNAMGTRQLNRAPGQRLSLGGINY